MAKQFIKFLQKSPYKDRLLRVMKDIYENNLDMYDIKPLIGQLWYFRIRIGNVRVIFIKTPEGNKIVEINNRGDIY